MTYALFYTTIRGRRIMPSMIDGKQKVNLNDVWGILNMAPRYSPAAHIAHTEDSCVTVQQFLAYMKDKNIPNKTVVVESGPIRINTEIGSFYADERGMFANLTLVSTHTIGVREESMTIPDLLELPKFRAKLAENRSRYESEDLALIATLRLFLSRPLSNYSLEHVETRAGHGLDAWRLFQNFRGTLVRHVPDAEFHGVRGSMTWVTVEVAAAFLAWCGHDCTLTGGGDASYRSRFEAGKDFGETLRKNKPPYNPET